MPTRHLLYTLLLAIGLTGCGGGGSETPTDPNATFRLGGNPLHVMRGMQVDLTGKDSDGDAWEGAVRVRALSPTTFGGEPVTPFQGATTLTHRPSGGFAHGVDTLYVNAAGHTVYSISDDGVECALEAPGDMPQTARIGEFGVIDAMTCSDGTRETGSWSLESAGNGRAVLVLSERTRDQYGSDEAFEETRLRITTGGAAEHVTIRVALAGLGTITMSGSVR